MSIISGNVRTVAERQAGFVALESLKRPWVESFILREGRTIPKVAARLSRADRLGTHRARWGIGRMEYAVLPGVYAVGNPSRESSVFATANYKMSFDALRSSLSGIDGWILVLDTKGINVWCAAGKGTFGTDELVSRIAKTKLASLVSHREIVLPQLGASGVSGHEVARRAGFRVVWGPVRARDIVPWLDAGRKKTEAMRTVTFTLGERLAVAPIEFARTWPLLPASLVLGFLFALPLDPRSISRAVPVAILVAGIGPVGTLLFPALLPVLPTRAFAVKGAFLGAAWALACALAFGFSPALAAGSALAAAPAVAFLSMNFTGSSTYTSQPGALLEVDRGFWPMAGSLVAGLAVAAASRILGI
jgi:hypothetical protein